MVLAMRHPDVFSRVACHSGDMYFAYCYFTDFPKHLNIVWKFGGTAKFLRAWERMKKRNDSSLHPAINTIAMASCYSPNPKSPLGFDLPFDEKTGEMRWDVWERWVAWDPVAMLPRYAKNLKKLRTRFLDCGTRDQFHLHWGARIFAARARRLGVPFVHEEFDDDHTSISYRYDRSLALLTAAGN
jgi:enterochelin esterase family protein